MTLNNLLKSLEDAAEVGVQLAEHQLSKDDAGNFKVKAIDNVCFALDEVKSRKKRSKVLGLKALIDGPSNSKQLNSNKALF